jgi:hypothetical protein
MPRGKSSNDPDMLAMALVGYEIEKKKIDEKIKELRAKLGGGKAAPAAKAAPATKRRKLSAAARKRISLAQKKRWAEQRKATGPAKGA